MTWVFKIILKHPALTIYFVALLLSLKFAIFDFNLFSAYSDSSMEYQIYLYLASHGHITFSYTKEWLKTAFGSQELLISSYFVTLFPALVQKILHSDPYWTFKLYSAFLIPFLPVVIYYLARKWNNTGWAMVCAILSCSWFIYLEGGYFQRTNIALIFNMLMMLAIVFDKWNWKIRYPVIALSAVGMPLSHYSVTFGAIGILIVSLIIVVVWRKRLLVKPIVFSIVCLITMGAVYYLGFHPGVLYKLLMVFNISTGVISIPEQSAIVVTSTLISTVYKGITMIGYFVTILLIVGWLITYKKEGMGRNVLTFGSMFAIGGAIAVPTLQALYGFDRIQYQAILPAIVYFPMGVTALADKLSISPKLLAGIIVGGLLVVSLIYSTVASRVGLL
jgi:hypothetical protein